MSNTTRTVTVYKPDDDGRTLLDVIRDHAEDAKRRRLADLAHGRAERAAAAEAAQRAAAEVEAAEAKRQEEQRRAQRQAEEVRRKRRRASEVALGKAAIDAAFAAAQPARPAAPVTGSGAVVIPFVRG